MTRFLFVALALLIASPALAQTPVCMAAPDGSCGRPTVKAAGAQPSATDTPLVVVVSPVGGNPCANPASLVYSRTGTTAGTTAVEIISAVASKQIFICSLTVIGVSGTTPTFSLVQGTGTNCGTGQSVLVNAWTTTAGAIYAFAGPVATGAVSNALCFLDTGSAPVQRYTLTYVQQ